MVFRGFVTIWSLATPPTRKSPFSESATTLGSTRLPLSVGTTRGTRLRTCATQVLVVPRSMPSMGFSRAVEPAILVVLPRPSEGDVVPSPLLAIGRRLVGPPPAALEEGGHGESAVRRGPRPQAGGLVSGPERDRGPGLVELPAFVERRIPGQLLEEA